MPEQQSVWERRRNDPKASPVCADSEFDGILVFRSVVACPDGDYHLSVAKSPYHSHMSHPVLWLVLY